MNLRYLALLFFIVFIDFPGHGQKNSTDANVVGHVVSGGEHIPYANVYIKGTTMGTVTDETGHYQLVNLPLGKLTLVVKMIGYKPAERTITAVENSTIEIKFELEEDILNLDEVVVSADRSEQKRTEAPVIVNTIAADLFSTSQSNTLGEGLNFTPGLRLENNCQNCGFTQIRMNGMEGPYTQVLINSRPVFSGLAGIYGLELIPSNMIEKVEIVRGGGSALYGSNAIAGTVNVILKDPLVNTYEVAGNYSLIGMGSGYSASMTPDYSVNLNTSMVSEDRKSGITLYGFNRKREMFDANKDGFSEMSSIDNLTLGTRIFHRFGYRNKVSVDFFNIRENREGGNKPAYLLHERDIAEAAEHDMSVASVTYEQFLREYDMLSAYASGQFVKRDSYYGANQSLSDYGNTIDQTYHFGIQYKAYLGKSSLITGIENTAGFLRDDKLGYPNLDQAKIENDSIIEIPHTGNTIIADQSSMTSGIFTQYEITLDKVKVVVGGRFDHYHIKNRANEEAEASSGSVFSPRISLKYGISEAIQGRINYSRGYRAPQIFDEDLHIETSGSRQVFHVNDPGLKQESSQSISVSLDFNRLIGKTYTGFLVEGFYTRLDDPFVNIIGEPNEKGQVYYTRKNAENGASVQGVNIELNAKPFSKLSLSSGFTWQTSKYDEIQDFNEKSFFRTPNDYGYFVVDWDISKKWSIMATGNYTGRMLIPYFGTETNPQTGELRKSERFLDMGFKMQYTIKLNGASLQWFSGVKNITNSYQSDFDQGIGRDPAYIYGPLTPRTIYMGLKFGNFLDR